METLSKQQMKTIIGGESNSEAQRWQIIGETQTKVDDENNG